NPNLSTYLVLYISMQQQKFKDGKGGLTLDIMTFLKKWLAEHIIGTDKKYTNFFNSRGLK
ncbi:MAG: hypothetical protein HQK97_13000, partial [Nitrospirae bacterium]|nr:hypothetical protein [Nitrospirota bacterium]